MLRAPQRPSAGALTRPCPTRAPYPNACHTPMPIAGTSNPRVSLTAAVVEVLDDWGLPADQQLALLGLDAESAPGGIMAFRNGTPLPEGEEIDARVRTLLGIASSLQHVLPHTQGACDSWIHNPLRNFGGRTPLSYMLENGLEGMIRIRDLTSGRGDGWG